MLVISELARVFRQLLRFSFSTGRILQLIVVVTAVIVLVVSLVAGAVAPVALYPFL